jgi:mono/diheme cytochrome c family protein
MKQLFAAALAALALDAGAQSAERGKLLYENHCHACHYEKLHQRDPERSWVRSFNALRAEVARRAELTKHRFSTEDLDDITEYLNRTHYKHPK